VDEGRKQLGALLQRQRLAANNSRPARPQLDEPPAQRDARRHLGRLAALHLAANLDDNALAFIKLPAAREDLPLGQEGWPVAADIDEHCAERRQQPSHAAKMYAAHLVAIAPLDKELDRDAVLEQRGAPLAWAGGDQQLAGQGIR
jgi:hypothetical protein